MWARMKWCPHFHISSSSSEDTRIILQKNCCTIGNNYKICCLAVRLVQGYIVTYEYFFLPDQTAYCRWRSQSPLTNEKE